MNEIIKLTAQNIGGETQQAVNARDLHSFLEVGKDFSTWIKDRIEKYGFVEDVDFVKIDSPKMGNQKGGDRRSIEYYISLSMGKELGMVERSDKGREIRRYFIRCEQELKEVKQQMPILPDFTNPAIAARAWADEVEKNQKLIEQAKADAPKVEFSEAVVASGAEMTITATAKVLGIGPRKLFDWLRLNGFLYKQSNQATQDAINRGYMVVRFHAITHADGVEQKAYPHVTGAGLFYFYGRLRKENLIQKNEELELVA